MRNGITKKEREEDHVKCATMLTIPPAIKGEHVYTCKAGQAGTLPQLDSSGSCEHIPPLFKTQSHLHAFSSPQYVLVRL